MFAGAGLPVLTRSSKKSTGEVRIARAPEGEKRVECVARVTGESVRTRATVRESCRALADGTHLFGFFQM